MGMHLCKEVRGQDKPFLQDELEHESEDSSAEKMGFFQKSELQIMQRSLQDDVMAENEHETSSDDMDCVDETEMKPDRNSMSSAKDDKKLSIEVSTTNCRIANGPLAVKRQLDSFAVQADDLIGEWGDNLEGDMADIGGSYVAMPDLDKLPDSLLRVGSKVRQWQTEPQLNLDDIKQAIERSSCPVATQSLYQARSMRQWDDGRLRSEVKAMKKQIKHLRIATSSPKHSTLPKCTKVETQDLVAVSGNEEYEVYDIHLGESDFIEVKTAEQIASSSDSSTTGSLETGNILHVQQD